MINRIDRKEKTFIKMRKRLNEIWEMQRNIPWVKLKEPEQKGWTINITLTSEAMKRDDAAAMLAAVQLCDKDFHLSPKNGERISNIRKNNQLNKVRHLFMTNRIDGTSSYGGPHLRAIPEKEFKTLDLDPQVRKHFSDISTVSHQKWGAITHTHVKYICTIPDHYLCLKVSKRMLTQYRNLDPELEREEKYLDDKLKEYRRTKGSNYDDDDMKNDPRYERKRWKTAITHTVRGDIEDPQDDKKLNKYV